MKLIKLLNICNCSILIASSIIVSTTSCSESKPIDKVAAEKYIADRTFSLMTYSPSSNVQIWGTGWIISDLTKNDFTDYKYYVATNWHVLNTAYKTESSTFYFADKSISDKLYSSDFIEFTSFQIEPDSNFYYDISKKEGIDFVVAKADFSSAPTSIKTKLDNLNQLQKEKGYITQFTDASSSKKNFITSNMATAGYPARDIKSNLYTTWECQIFSTSDISLRWRNDLYHFADLNFMKDISYQYTFNKNVGKSFMSEGASGSMLIGDYDGEYKVAGIYWGGYTDEATETEFYPSFSILNTDKKNFLEKYL